MDFEILLQSNGIRTAPEGHHHSGPGWLQFDCPFCDQGNNNYHMGYNLTHKYINCWNCGHHSIIETMILLFGISYTEAKTIAKDIRPERSQLKLHTGHYREPYGVNPLHNAHKRYIRSRGFNWQHIAELWSVQGIALASPAMQWRLFLPIFYRSERVSWTTRTINKKVSQRYLSAKSENETIPHKTLLYGEDYARHAIVVVEGPIDVWAIGPGAVATFGLSITSAQILKMSKYPIRAVCLDNTKQAQATARKLVDSLSGYKGETYNIQLSGKDAAETSAAELKQIRKDILT